MNRHTLFLLALTVIVAAVSLGAISSHGFFDWLMGCLVGLMLGCSIAAVALTYIEEALKDDGKT